MNITGKVMKGWVIISRNGLKDDADLLTWLKLAISFVKTLKPK